MLTFDETLLINQWVQGIKGDADLLAWYDAAVEDRKAEILRELVDLCRNARPHSDDGARAVAASGIKPGRSACVILSKTVDATSLHRVTQLRGIDGRDAYLLLFHLLRVADDRRRSQEDQPCHHWWHRDLGDPSVVASLRQKYASGTL